MGWLGFKIAWERQFGQPPQYIQVSRGNLVPHSSEHDGGACAGPAISVEMGGMDEFHREVPGEGYNYNCAGLEHTPSKTKCCEMIDRFGNRIRFNENAPK